MGIRKMAVISWNDSSKPKSPFQSLRYEYLRLSGDTGIDNNQCAQKKIAQYLTDMAISTKTSSVFGCRICSPDITYDLAMLKLKGQFNINSRVERIQIQDGYSPTPLPTVISGDDVET